MTKAFLHRLEELSRLLLKMASFSEAMVEKALDALVEQNVTQAKLVIVDDVAIDQMELEIDKHIFNCLALLQPVASDLRFLVAAQKINNDLERIGDHAVNIAEAALALADAPHIKPLINIPVMSRIAREMLRGAIDSFVFRDPHLAMAVKKRDDEIDALYKQVQGILDDIIQEHPKHFLRAAHLLAVATNIERIADHATNIAEEVVFITEAETTKHVESQRKSCGSAMRINAPKQRDDDDNSIHAAGR